jgi:hypothetical protein
LGLICPITRDYAFDFEIEAILVRKMTRIAQKVLRIYDDENIAASLARELFPRQESAKKP